MSARKHRFKVGDRVIAFGKYDGTVTDVLNFNAYDVRAAVDDDKAPGGFRWVHMVAHDSAVSLPESEGER
jgi:DUF971 family protein